MSEIVLYTDGTRGQTEQLRLFLYETGLKYDEVAVTSTEAKEKLVREGKLMYGTLPALQIGKFVLNESTRLCMHAFSLRSCGDSGAHCRARRQE